MRSQKKIATLLFEEFSVFLGNSTILFKKFDKDAKEDFESLSGIFERKIRRCEVGSDIILPSQLDTARALFKLLSKGIKRSLSKRGNYLDTKDGIISSAIADMKTRDADDAPLRKLMGDTYLAFHSAFVQNERKILITLKESKKAFTPVMNEYPYYHAEEMVDALNRTFHSAFAAIQREGVFSKQRFMQIAAERLNEKGLLSEMFEREVAGNIAWKCLHFLEMKGCVQFHRGQVKVNGTFTQGLREFESKMKVVIGQLPFTVSKELMGYTAHVTGAFQEAVEAGTFGKERTIEGITATLIKVAFEKIRKAPAEVMSSEPADSAAEVLKSYKIGLRPPESLVNEWNDLVMQCEVLRFFRKFHSRKMKEKLAKRGISRPNFKGFKIYKNLTQYSTIETINKYKRVFEQYSTIKLDSRALNIALNEVKFKMEIRKHVRDHLRVVSAFLNVNVMTIRRITGITAPKYTFEEFTQFYDLESGPRELVRKFPEMFDNYKNLGFQRNFKELVHAYEEIFKKCRTLGRKKAKKLLLSEIPHVQDPEMPSPFEISLGEYQYRAGKSFKKACSHFNTVAEEIVVQIPEEKEAFLEKAVEMKGVSEKDLKNALHTLEKRIGELETSTEKEREKLKKGKSAKKRALEFLGNAAETREKTVPEITEQCKNIIAILESRGNLEAKTKVALRDSANGSLRSAVLQFLFQEVKEQHLSNFKGRPERAISTIVGFSGNHDLIAFKHVSTMMAVYRDMRSKVQDLSSLMFLGSDEGPDFSDAWHVLLAFYSPPNHLRRYLAGKWGVDKNWTRDQIVGFRRKVDPHLPLRFQIESLTGLFTKLADHYIEAHARKNEDARQVIFALQEQHVLHLLPGSIDLSYCLKEELHEAYHELKEGATPLPEHLKEELDEHVIIISAHEFVDAARMKLQSVMATIERLNDALEGASESEREKITNSIERSRTFFRKVELLKECVVTDHDTLAPFLEHYVVGNKFTGSFVKFMSTLPMVKRRRMKKLFTALRDVAALAFAEIHDEATAQFEDVFTPDNCLTLPFTSEKRKKNYLPAHLLDKKFVALHRRSPPRAGEKPESHCINNKEASKFLKEGIPTWLGIPIYTDEQFINGKIKGARKGLFWFQLVPNKMIIECLNNGAELTSISLNVPRGPTNKIDAVLTLSAKKKDAFLHRGKFLKKWEEEFPYLQFPKHDYLGSDFNRIGTHSVATATPREEIDLTRGSNLMKPHEDAHAKLELLRKHEIPSLQRKIEFLQEEIDIALDEEGKVKLEQNLGRVKAQLTLLHRKRRNLMVEMKRQSLMVYLYVGYKTGAKYLAWDGIQGISTRGQPTGLALAVTYMPKEKGLFDLFIEWASDLKQQGLLPNYIATIPVSPFNSSVCGDCYARTGVRRKTRDTSSPYDDFWCTIETCGKMGNRHSNSAQVAALELQFLMETHHGP